MFTRFLRVITIVITLVSFRTKRMIVDVLKVQPGENLTEILETTATDEQVTRNETADGRGTGESGHSMIEIFIIAFVKNGTFKIRNYRN